MRIVFMGTPDFAKESLEALVKANYDIEAVVTNPDRPRGRGMKMMESDVKKYAKEVGISKIYQPEKIRKNEDFINEMKKLKPDLIVVVAYGKILPKAIIEVPRYGCINVHGSLLPKYRGAAPIQWSILNGDKVTGVTTMYMDAGLDDGDMILKKELTIGDNETTGELWERMSKLGAELLVETVNLIEKGEAPRAKQPNEFSVAPMIDKKMANIKWKEQSSIEIKNLIRGLNPFMGAYSFYEGKKIKFWRAEVYSNEELLNRFPDLKEYEEKFLDLPEGTVLFSDAKTGLYIKTKDSVIKVVELQGENSKKMTAEEFLRGNHIYAGFAFSETP